MNGQPATLTFQDRILLGPYTELNLLISAAYAPYRDQVKANLVGKPFVVAIHAGNNCESWTPGDLFFEETKHLNYLVKRFNGICVFTDNSAARAGVPLDS